MAYLLGAINILGFVFVLVLGLMFVLGFVWRRLIRWMPVKMKREIGYLFGSMDDIGKGIFLGGLLMVLIKLLVQR